METKGGGGSFLLELSKTICYKRTTNQTISVGFIYFIYFVYTFLFSNKYFLEKPLFLLEIYEDTTGNL